MSAGEWPNVERRRAFDDIDARRESWKVRNAGHPDVAAWLAKNPPPPSWSYSALDWAWLEMPLAPE